jgi:hypothetical protein
MTIAFNIITLLCLQDDLEAGRPSKQRAGKGRADEDEDEREEGEERADVDELRAIQLSRTQLESMHDKLFFEGEWVLWL